MLIKKATDKVLHRFRDKVQGGEDDIQPSVDLTAQISSSLPDANMNVSETLSSEEALVGAVQEKYAEDGALSNSVQLSGRVNENDTTASNHRENNNASEGASNRNIRARSLSPDIHIEDVTLEDAIGALLGENTSQSIHDDQDAQTNASTELIKNPYKT